MSARNDLHMRFLKIKNYRQYYGEQTIDLSPSKGNINIIQGENGEGKSNILNAINYCLYLKEPHLKKVSPLLPIVNLRAMQEAPIGGTVDMEIELELGNENTRHRIRRTVYTKRVELQKDGSRQNSYAVQECGKLGTFPVNSKPWDAFEIKSVEKNSAGWTDVANKESFIQERLPKGLSPFYFLDGEFLESLHVKFDKIKDGVEEISQLNLVFSAISHIKNVLRDLEDETRGMDPEIDRYQMQVNQAKEWLDSVDGAGNKKYSDARGDTIWWKKEYDSDDELEHHPYSGRPRLASKTEEKEVLKARITEIDRELAEHNSSSVRSWSTELQRLDERIKKDECCLDEKNKERGNHIATIGPEIYLDSCIQNFIDLVDEKRSKGELPVKWTEIFVDDLLSHNRCICGNDLTRDVSRKALIEWREKSKESERLDVAIEATADFKARKGTLKERLSNLDQFRREINSLERDLDEYRIRRKELKQNLKNSDESKIRDLAGEKEARQNMFESTQRETLALEYDIGRYETALKEAKVQLSKAERKSKRLEQKMATVSLCRRTLAHLERIRDNVLTNMRAKVADSTKDNFFNLIWKKNEFSGVDLTDDYQLVVIKSGFNAVHTLSAGEKLVLTLSFIVAIRNITGFKTPLIIDTPLGKISGKPTKNIADFISNFSRDVQVTLLVTDKEYQFVDPEIGQSFRNLIKDSVNKEYVLDRNSQEDTTVRVMK